MSFKDTFTKDDKQDEVEYDEAASYTFFMSILIVILIPLIYKIIKRIFFKVDLEDKNKFLNCGCKYCKQRLENHVNKKKTQRFNRSFYIMVILVISLGYVLTLQYNKILENNDIKESFYEIKRFSKEKALSGMVQKDFLLNFIKLSLWKWKNSSDILKEEVRIL